MEVGSDCSKEKGSLGLRGYRDESRPSFLSLAKRVR